MKPSALFSFYPHAYNDNCAFSERWHFEALFARGPRGWRLFRTFPPEKTFWDFSPLGILTWYEEGSDPFQVHYGCFPEKGTLHVGCDLLGEPDEGVEDIYRIRPIDTHLLWLLDVLSPETYGTSFVYRVTRR